MLSSRGKKTALSASKKRKGAASSSGPTTEIKHPFLQTVMTNFDNPGTVQFRHSGLVRQLSRDLVPASATYDLSRSKASALPSSLGYLHAILAHTLTGR
ncbi:hypothetical protein GOBAR_AA14908 [Gossypium barbadense]|uniref:Uncharacterized protein n=1 Tax=Gossypium barbadense TaxID=3634 RepID=A0A2P5XQY0_GOSBA|nr:hypothetical protein GOBAR_AA14908 [Gossypium barbadense]